MIQRGSGTLRYVSGSKSSLVHFNVFELTAEGQERMKDDV